MGMAPDMGGESSPGSYNWQKGRIAELEAENAKLVRAIEADGLTVHECGRLATLTHMGGKEYLLYCKHCDVDGETYFTQNGLMEERDHLAGVHRILTAENAALRKCVEVAVRCRDIAMDIDIASDQYVPGLLHSLAKALSEFDAARRELP